MKRLIFTSIFLSIVLYSCTSNKKKASISEPEKEIYTIHPSYSKLTYDAEIHFFGTNHKGKFKIEKDHFSDKTICVLSSEESMKLFEANIDSAKNFEIVYIDEALQGKKVEEILETDLQMLFKHTVHGQPGDILHNSSGYYSSSTIQYR